jgi:formate hydrogenlyase subunit 3/multisubunit Na+/H+ antiporter MnhD subunit
MVMSVITMVVGNVMPLLQNDLKRLLAYSSIAQVGYMLAGLSIGTQLALTGTFLHLLNHALMKGTAFLCAGAILYTIGTRQMDEMAGIGRKMPITAIAFAISLFALTGLPPLNGFVSELIIVTAAFQSNLAWLGVAVILNSALSAAFYLRIVRTLILPIKSEKVASAREAPLALLVPICFMAALIILIGLWPDPVIRIVQQSVAALFSFSGKVMG